MFHVIRSWFDRYFSDPEAVLLFVLLIGGFGLIITMGEILAPVLASIVLAYCLEWLVGLLAKTTPRLLAVTLVFVGFLGVFFAALLLLMPMMWRQLINLFNDLPSMIQKAQSALYFLVDEFPNFVTTDQIQTLTDSISQDIQGWGKQIITASISSIPDVMAWIVYLILVPLMIFFFLKDSTLIQNWFVSFLPKKHNLLSRVWAEVNDQIGNYIRGKVLEILIVGFATYLVFLYTGLRYPVLLASLVGLSVVIPYVGAAVVTIPVALVAYIDWGWGADFAYLLIAYGIVQALDGNVLVPLLFSEAVNLHPVAIIVAILVFGGVWGFWGVFFAIPLATLFKAVLNAWPKKGASNHKPRYRRRKPTTRPAKRKEAEA